MSHNIITECPACHTRFQVTPGQLKIASGKVRCGACLEVFNAQIYRCDDLEAPADDLDNDPLDDFFEGRLDELMRQLEQPSPEPATQEAHLKDPLFDEIEVPPLSPPTAPDEGFDKRYVAPGVTPEPMTTPASASSGQSHTHRTKQTLPEQVPGLLTRRTTQQLTRPQPEPRYQPETPPAEPRPAPQNKKPLNQPVADNETDKAEAGTAARPDEQTQTANIRQAQQPVSETNNEQNLDQPVSELLQGTPPSEDEDQLLQISLIDAEPEPQPEPGSEADPQPEASAEEPARPEPEAQSAAKTEQPEIPGSDALPQPLSESRPQPEAPLKPGVKAEHSMTVPQVIKLPTGKQTDNPMLKPEANFRAEPVMIRTTQEKTPFRTGWAILSLLAIVLLAAQYLWFNRQQLSRHDELVPLYSQICQHLQCNLETPIMLDQLSPRKLTIRQHPDYQGALSVNLLLENQAKIAQPFPAIQLSFSDRLGRLISQRLFQPDEYLDAAPDDTLKIAARQSVQIQFAILDPGRRALSYEIDLKAPASENKGL